MHIRYKWRLGLFFMVFPLWAQSDNLVSKSLGLVFEHEKNLLVFDQDNLSFSAIDILTEPSNPPRITNFIRDKDELVNAFIWDKTVVGSPVEDRSDSLRSLRLIQLFAQLNSDHGIEADGSGSLMDLKINDDEILNGVAIHDLTFTDSNYNDSSILIAFGTGGIGRVRWSDKEVSQTILMDNSGELVFMQVPNNSNNFQFASCDHFQPICETSTFSLLNSGDTSVSVDELQVVTDGSDETYIIFGSHASTPGKGLRRFKLGDSSFQIINSEGLDTVSVKKIFVNPNNNMVWVFTEGNFFISEDAGLTFSTPNGFTTEILASLINPEVVFIGDTTIVNFDFSRHPGLVIFEGNQLQVNSNETANTYEYILEPSLSLPENVELFNVATALLGNSRVIAVGSKSQGLYYKVDGGEWIQINRQIGVGKNLSEVITFPTIFNGEKDVGLGYQLEKNGDVTIDVYNYAMEHVKNIVKKAARIGGQSRSENVHDDKWDGKDRHGNYVSSGLYYILIQSTSGEKGWGKVMVVRGR